MKFYKDDETAKFTDSEDFSLFLRDVEGSTSWLDPVSSNEWRFVFDPTTKKAEKDFSEADIDSYQNNKIFLQISGDIYSIRDCAWQSVLRRCGIEGKSIHKLIESDLPEACAVLNKCSVVAETEASPSIVNGKINCLVSPVDSSNGYSIIPATFVYDETLSGIIELAGDLPESFSGLWSYSGICCKWIIPLQHTINSDTFKTQIVLCTSDNGLGAIQLRADLSLGARIVPCISPIVIEHRTDRKQLTFNEAMKMLRVSVQQGRSKVENLSRFKLDYPVSALRNVMRRCNIVAKYTEKVCLEFEKTNPVPGLATAYDCYIAMGLVLDYYEAECKNYFYHEKVKANMMKALEVDWSKYDYKSSSKIL